MSYKSNGSWQCLVLLIGARVQGSFLVFCAGPICHTNYKMGKKSKRKTKTKPPAVVVDDVTITSDEVLFKDPPAKEDCPICFLPMPVRLLSCISLPDATIPCQSLTSRLQMRD